MPKLSKRMREEWLFFINSDTGRRTFNKLCRSCKRECKQSFRALIVTCPRYQSKKQKIKGG